EPGAQERRGLGVGVAVGERKAVALVGDGHPGVATVDLVTREARTVAEVLAARPAMLAGAARPAQPRNSDPRSFRESRASGFYDPNDFVAEHERQLRIRQLAVQDMQICPAHAAGADAQEHLPGLWNGIRQLAPLQWTSRLDQHHRSHAATPPAYACARWPSNRRRRAASPAPPGRTRRARRPRR